MEPYRKYNDFLIVSMQILMNTNCLSVNHSSLSPPFNPTAISDSFKQSMAAVWGVHFGASYRFHFLMILYELSFCIMFYIYLL